MLRHTVFHILLYISVFVGFADPASAGKRVALVIGNAAYTEIKSLPNPRNDADLMGRTLREVGFDVVSVTDADRRAMGRAIQRFGKMLREAGPDAVGLFYYAGHGVQSRGQNFLVPLRSSILDEADLALEAISAADVLAQMEAAGNALNLVILDACRDNPFASVRGADGRGLARVEAAGGSLVAFAAAPGESAADGDGANSPYTLALAETLREPGLPIEQVFKRVRIQVRHATSGRQTPWEESSLLGDFYFVPGNLSDEVTSNSLQDRAAWTAIQNTQSKAVLEAFIDEFPDSIYAKFAKARLEEFDVAVGVFPDQAPTQPPDRYDVGDEFRDCDNCPTLVVVPRGTFTIGSTQTEDGHTSSEEPQLIVTIDKSFAVGKFEVTAAEWENCVADGACADDVGDVHSQSEMLPVRNVSWADAKDYVVWLAGITGKRYRLLSEAEWEYAARAGSTTPFSTGDSISPLDANYNGGFGYNPSHWVGGEFKAKPTNVGTYPANAFGLHDMHGNLWEWVEDCWQDDYSRGPTDGVPHAPENCARHVLRGGSWLDRPRSLRSARRFSHPAASRNVLFGFRVARHLEP